MTRLTPVQKRLLGELIKDKYRIGGCITFKVTELRTCQALQRKGYLSEVPDKTEGNYFFAKLCRTH